MHEPTTHARTPVTDMRWVPLSSGHNVRDLGGFRTTDGRCVKWGRVLRSGTMAYLQPDDIARMKALGLRTICDLRGNGERLLEPTGWEAMGCHTYWFRDHKDSSGDLARLATREEGVDVERMRRAMIRLYGIMAFSQEESFRAVFAHLLADDMPLLFHCAAGKDRTGAMSALLLLALGVERDEVIADFLLSNECAEQRIAMFSRHPDALMRQLAALSRQVASPVFHVEATYLDTMLDAIVARHGTMDAYFETAMGLDAAARERLRGALLE